MNRGRRDLHKGVALGIMSGTSADGLSLALVELATGSLRVLSHADYPYSTSLRRRILAAVDGSVAELTELHYELGRLYAEWAAGFLRTEGVSSKGLSAVGCHGQTVFHESLGRKSATLQIGEPSFLAEALGVPIVADFRPRDIAAGGLGAPLAPFLDEWLFGDGPPRALQNIGGIGNVSLVGRGVRTLGFDTGPGNCLMDLAVSRLTRGRLGYDRDGRLAAKGLPDKRLVGRLLKGAYFLKRPPKSLERTEYGSEYLDRCFARDPGSRAGQLPTLNYFTAASIADAYRRFLSPALKGRRLHEVVVSGGGALNPVLMRNLAELLAPVPVVSSAVHGLAPLAKEPALVALLAWLAVRGETNHCPAATGARGPRVLGKLIR